MLQQHSFLMYVCMKWIRRKKRNHVFSHTAKLCIAIQIHQWFPLDVLTLRLDFVTQNQVGGQSEGEKKYPQYHEVHVKLRILHVQ